jgi:hypothetical protein
MDIQLNFINQSNDTDNSDVVIFQKNVALSQETAIAWTVIQNCGRGDNHPFAYPMAQGIAYCDSYGNFTPQLPAQPGQQFSAVLTSSGDSIQMSGAANSRSEIELRNALAQGAITALLYKSGRTIAEVTGIAPGQDAAFELKPTIWIGVTSQIEQGQVLDSAILADINTEISLLGIRSADIVMTGGGGGPDATPFLFTLQNVVMA